MNVDAQQMYYLLLLAPGLLFSLTVHEFAHARMALAYGDPTAKLLGRVSLNPLRHLDPMGTIMLALTAFGKAPFGWAKPVPYNPLNVHPLRLGQIMISLAGPLSNLALAVVTFGLVKLWMALDVHMSEAVFTAGFTMFLKLTVCNVCLAVFNIIPLYPLDGHHVVRELLPLRQSDEFMHWQVRYGSIVLLALLVGPWLLRNTGSEFQFNPIGSLLGLIARGVYALV
ncbi:MAG: site-2 protease family protein [Planctomycetaceae bacterium]|nr:site-2 protease family protein [Planctomycetaceae bacterium]